MVKRTLFVMAVALGAVAGWGLGPRESTTLVPAVTSFPGVRPGPYASLLLHGGSIVVVVADRDTASLRMVEVPIDGTPPALAPAPVFVDRIDIAAPLGASFGVHAAGSTAGGLRLLYLDREREDRQLLKRVAAMSSGWRLELVEPVGLPVAVLAGPGGTPLDVWESGYLLARGPAGDRRLWPEILPRGPGLPIAPADGGSPTGFTVWDDAGATLLATRVAEDGPRTDAVGGAGPVHAMAEAPDGTLGIVTWDEANRRILLLERAPGASTVTSTTVTICDGVNGLFLAWTPAGWLFVYDEVRPSAAGRWTWDLVVLIPGAKAVGRPQYRRGVLSSGPGAIAGLRAVVAGGSLFVLEMRDGLRLLKVALP